jgi:hypothetical protein
MRRFFVMAAALAIPVALVACGDDGGSSDSDTTDASTDVDTISLDEWIEEADEICASNDDEIEDLDQPSADPSDTDLSDEELEEVSDYLNEISDLQQDTVDSLRALPPPDEDADEVEDTIDLVQAAVDDTRSAAEAAADGDQDEMEEQLSDASEQFDEAGEMASDIGLRECGAGTASDTGNTGSPTGDDTGDNTGDNTGDAGA